MPYFPDKIVIFMSFPSFTFIKTHLLENLLYPRIVLKKYADHYLVRNNKKVMCVYFMSNTKYLDKFKL